jgi:hypothetical protein
LNIDQLVPKINVLASIMHRQSMTQLIKLPTRITENSKSLIDVIITNQPERNKQSGVIRNGLSDHDIIYTVRKLRKQFETHLTTRKVRNFKNIDSEKVRETIKSAPWWTLQSSETAIDNKYDIFCEIMKIVLNKHAPLKKRRVKTTKPMWMTKKYTDLLSLVDKAKSAAIKTNLPKD